jgi:transposase-like protein
VRNKTVREAEQIGNCAAARKFDVSESSIKSWRNKKDCFLQNSSHQWAYHGQKAKCPEAKEKFSSHLNGRQQFGYMSSKMY